MEEKIRAGLDAVFAKHEAAKKVAAEKKRVAETKEEAFGRAFMEAREAIIRPAMVAMGEYLKERGYQYEITSSDETSEPGRRTGPVAASITLSFFVDGQRRSVGETPHFIARCDKRGELVEFHQSTMTPGRGGMTGGAGNATLSDLSEALVQEKIMHVVAEVFR